MSCHLMPRLLDNLLLDSLLPLVTLCLLIILLLLDLLRVGCRAKQVGTFSRYSNHMEIYFGGNLWVQFCIFWKKVYPKCTQVHFGHSFCTCLEKSVPKVYPTCVFWVHFGYILGTVLVHFWIKMYPKSTQHLF